jgi:very-short-patch-repair endonuclease
MRSESTEAEHRLWQLLRAHRFAGYKFRRQVPLDFYIADFVCFSERLVVELDGGQHAESTRDERRDSYLKAQSFRVIRVWNSDLFTDEDGVAELVLSALRTPPLPNPSPARGEGL